MSLVYQFSGTQKIAVCPIRQVILSNLVEGALQATESLERVEVEQESDADDNHVLPDTTLLTLDVSSL